MIRGVLLVAFLVLILTACVAPRVGSQGPMRGMDEGMMQRHMAPIPDEYAGMTNPVPADAESLKRGKTSYETYCASCHGDEGWGDGPSAENLDPPPASLAHTAQMFSDAYLYYRITEGGGFAPFNSSMPAWDTTLRETQRWDVINYIRSLDGGMMGGTVMDGSMMGWMMVWGVISLLLLVSIIAAALAAVIWFVRRGSTPKQQETAVETLKRRYASGEISSEKFEQMKRQLSEQWTK